MKPKRVKMLRRQRRKELNRLIARILPEYHEELKPKIEAINQNPKSTWQELVTLLEYYALKGPRNTFQKRVIELL